ncbi:MAG: UbiA family prenyltransferase [Halobacteriaceae archaeon]
MRVARHGPGPASAARAALSQVHPVFMLPPVAASLFGAVLADGLAAVPAVLHVLTVFFGLYTAHVKDGYVDFYHRDEDDDHPVTAAGCRLLLGVSTAAFAIAAAALWAVAGPAAAALTLPGWVIGYFHAPQLDSSPVTATIGYPLGIALALCGGYVAQAGTLSTQVLSFAAVFLLLLSGIKIVDDAQDYDYDRSIAKRTVAVVVGPRRARAVAYALFAAGLGGVVVLALAGPFPTGSIVAAIAFGTVALTARRAGPELATMLLIRGAYLFMAALVASVWFHPL